jgi:hypothetical protein
VTNTRTAVEDLKRQIELIKEALSVSDEVARADPSTAPDAMKLNAHLKDQLEDMLVELAQLGGRPQAAPPHADLPR